MTPTPVTPTPVTPDPVTPDPGLLSPISGRTMRPLVETDIPALQTIDVEAHGQAWSHRMFLDEVEQSNRVHLVAHTDAGVVGHAAAWLDASSCRITNVTVAAQHHGHGHGTAMMLTLISQVLDTSRVANLQLEVRPANRRAQRMYSRFGFVPVGVERNFYDRSDDQGSTDAVVMAVADVCADSWRNRLAELQAAHDHTETDRGAGAAA